MLAAFVGGLTLAVLAWRRRQLWMSRLSLPLVGYMAVCGIGLALLVLVSQPPRHLGRVGLGALRDFALDFNARHIVFYFGFAVVAASAWRRRLSLALIGVLLMAFGYCLELTQKLVPGRTFRITDLLSNGLGILLGLCWVYLYNSLLGVGGTRLSRFGRFRRRREWGGRAAPAPPCSRGSLSPRRMSICERKAGGSTEGRRRLRLLWVSLTIALIAPPLEAAVERIEIQERAPFAQGAPFGTVGSYERIRGQLHFAVDPEHPGNAAIVDLKLAPRDARGRVTFTADFILLRPADLSRGNHRLLYEVSNRGNLGALAMFNEAGWNNDPTSRADAGNGFLFEQGYSLLWSGWNWDVLPVRAACRSICRPPPSRASRSPDRWPPSLSWHSGAKARHSCGATRAAIRRSRWRRRKPASVCARSRTARAPRSPAPTGASPGSKATGWCPMPPTCSMSAGSSRA